ncbi:TetR family transcriptional regulator [Nonomuraea angiospora]
MTVADIADRAGVGRTTFFRYFPRGRGQGRTSLTARKGGRSFSLS